jgi:hypothetical protein
MQILQKLAGENYIDDDPGLQQQAECTEYKMQISVMCKQKERATAVRGVSGSAAPHGSSTSPQKEIGSGLNKSKSKTQVVKIVATCLDSVNIL